MRLHDAPFPCKTVPKKKKNQPKKLCLLKKLPRNAGREAVVRCVQQHAPLRPAGGRAASRGEEEEEEAALRTGMRHLPAPGGAGFIPRRSLSGGKNRSFRASYHRWGDEVSRSRATRFCPSSKQKQSHETLLTDPPKLESRKRWVSTASWLQADLGGYN